MANKPAAGNAGIASQLAIGHHWPGVPEPERSASEYVCFVIRIFDRGLRGLHG
jgi:hypothetical protein